MTGRARRLAPWLVALAISGAPLAIGAVRTAFAEEPAASPAELKPEPGAAAPGARPQQHRLSVMRNAAAPADWGMRAVSLGGLAFLIGLMWLLSNDRRRVDWKLVGWGLGLQLVFAVMVLKTGPGRWFFEKMNDVINGLLDFTKVGATFLFRSFVTGQWEGPLVNFAFSVLPSIIFFSSLMAVLYHLRVMQQVVKAFAWVMQKTMHTSGAETLSASANIFLGQTEAPLIVKPFVAAMTNSELMCVMVGGFANTAGSVLAAYVGMLKDTFPDIAGHLLAQSVMSAPAALVCAKIMYPEDGEPQTRGTLHAAVEQLDTNVIDAAARGAREGLDLAFNVAAMLLAFIALVSLLNWGLGFAAGFVGFPNLSFQQVVGWLFWPFAFAMGTPPAECAAVGQLLGEKLVLNEFVAYAHLQRMLEAGDALSYRSVTLASYALSGFANFASIAIQIGGIGGMAPSRRHDLAKLGLRALLAGTLACQMTANVAGMLL